MFWADVLILIVVIRCVGGEDTRGEGEVGGGEEEDDRIIFVTWAAAEEEEEQGEEQRSHREQDIIGQTANLKKLTTWLGTDNLINQLIIN